MKSIIDRFFNVSYEVNNEKIEKLSMKIKKEMLPIKKVSSNGSSIQWYIDKFGDILGTEIYNVRRKYNSSNKIAEYLINTDTDECDKILLRNYINLKNESRKSSNKKRYSDIAFKRNFIEIMNKPERIDKISKKSKEMWANAKSSNLELYHRMINSSKGKNYILNGVKMNSIEYLVGSILNELNIKWKYESVMCINNHTYRPDFYCKEYNMVVECYGDFWHANPQTMGTRTHTHKTRTVESVRMYDRIKEDDFISNGYEYLYLWESDILDNLNKIKNEIKNRI